MSRHESLILDTPLLVGATPEDVRALADRGVVRSYPAGTVIFREGDPGDSFHTILEGMVKITIGSQEGDEFTVAQLGPGESFGDLALLDGRPRSASATAVHQTNTLMVTRAEFQSWLAARPTVSRALLESLSLRLRRTNESLADLVFLDLPSRLAKRLLHLAGAHHPSGPSAHTRISITQAELASMLGVSRESVNKQLKAFAQEGYISIGRSSLELIDVSGLRRVLASGRFES